ncbi:MAG: class II glutamine amidotransferase [Actinomycetota bacterium]
MCELMAVAWERAEPLRAVLPWAAELERLGVAGFGWGVAWLDDEGNGVRGYRNQASLSEDSDGAEALSDVRSSRFLVHLRRPSRLSTVQVADSQPFLDQRHGCAFCHNGLFARAEELRDRYAGRLHGRADSEVGFLFLQDLLDEGARPEAALPRTLDDMAGSGNLGYLGADGTLLMMAGHPANDLWRFRAGGSATVAATALHSADESVFDLVFPDATDRRKIAPREVVEVGGPVPAPRIRAAS